MKPLILLVICTVGSTTAVLAADTPCYYNETSIIVNKYDALCTPKDNGNSSCRIPMAFSVISDCRKDAEIFYLCRTSIEYSTGGMFSSIVRTSTDTIGSVVIHDGKGDGTLNILWESLVPVKNIKVTQLTCYPTDLYPIEEQR